MNQKIIQITSGRGPIECEWAVAQVLRIFTRELKDKNIKYTILQSILGQQNGILQSVTFELKAEKKILENFLDYWLGAVQYIGKSPYRKFHKRKNWFIGIFEISNLEEVKISDHDIEYQAVRARGAGGQNVNKVNTAVRATHTATRLSVFAMDSRSQLENKKLEKQRLIEKLSEINLGKIKNQIQEQWINQLSIQRGNPVQTFIHEK